MNIKYTIKYSFTTKYSYDYYKVIATINKNLISHYFDEDKLTKSFTLEYKDINVSEDNSQGIIKSYEDNSFKCSKA